jgi:hypothetical protein
LSAQRIKIQIEGYFQVFHNFLEISRIISSSQGKIEFVKSGVVRRDTQSPKKALQYIRVYDVHDDLVKEVELVQNYFVSPYSSKPSSISPSTTGCTYIGTKLSALTERLSLQEVVFREIVDVPNSNPKSYSYKMNYNTSVKLPYKWSNAQDHWGYYNGADNSNSLLPSSIGNLNLGVISNREVVPNYTQANILQSIEFPEGGTTEFTFENNEKSPSSPITGYTTKKVILDANLSTSHQINSNGNSTDYTFNRSFTIPNTAVSIAGNATKTEVNYDGFTSRCSNTDTLYDVNGPNAICNEMFFSLYEQGVATPLLNNIPIWQSGTIILDKETTYRVEIDMTITSYQNGLGQTVTDYDFNQESTYVEIDWKENSVFTPGPNYLGGLRVSDIKNYNEDGLAKHKAYKYENGYSLSKPSYLKSTLLVTQDGLSNTYIDEIHQTIEVVSQSWIPLITTQSKFQGYETVYEIFKEVNKNTSGLIPVVPNTKTSNIIKRTYLSPRGFGTIFPGAPYEPLVDRDELKSEEVSDKTITSYDYNNRSFRSDEHLWGYQPSSAFNIENFDASLLTLGPIIISSGIGNDNALQCGIYSACQMAGNVYQIAPKIDLLLKTTSTNIEDQEHLIKTTENQYDPVLNHYNPIQTRTTESTGKIVESFMKYPQDLNDIGLLSDNKINTVLETTVYKDNVLLQTVKNEYRNFGGNYLLDSVKAAKGNNILEARLVYHDYYSNGNIKEVSKRDGTHIVYIWGYNQSVPIAKIENATYAQVSSYVTNLQNISNLDDDRTLGSLGDEGVLRTALNNLRTNLSNAMVTTFTYDPLIGVTSITDPRGDVIYYQYDGFNRLETVKDKDGNVLKENQYHYKN